MKPRARVWYDPPRTRGLRWYRHGAYMWECSCSPRARGRNHFNRFTDRVRNGSQRVHPHQRCVAAVDRHFWEHHRTEARRKICDQRG